MTDKTKEQKIDEILGKALRDRGFRTRLTTDPKAAAEECGLSVEEMDLISGGLAIGDSLLNPQTVAWCTGKTCNETGGRVKVRPDDYRIRPTTRPDIRVKPTVRPGPGVVRQSAEDESVVRDAVKEEVE
jgi:hypothetical protein